VKADTRGWQCWVGWAAARGWVKGLVAVSGTKRGAMKREYGGSQNKTEAGGTGSRRGFRSKEKYGPWSDGWPRCVTSRGSLSTGGGGGA